MYFGKERGAKFGPKLSHNTLNQFLFLPVIDHFGYQQYTECINDLHKHMAGVLF